MIKIRIYLILLTVILQSHLWAASYFVTPTGAGSKLGDNWGNAMGTGEFSLKLINASQGDVFYLSEGNYIPLLDKTGTATQLGAQTFRLLPGVSIFGSYKTGLTGTASAESDRNLRNATGELSPTTIFDGNNEAYMIIDAQNAGITPAGAVTLNGIIATHSRMSAIYVEKSELKMAYCQVTDNNLATQTYVGSVNGAAIYIKDATATISNSEISGNNLDGGDMGTSAPVWVENGVLNIVNSLIADNASTNGGAPAVLLENSTGNIINSTISGNGSDNPELGAVTVGTSSHLNIISSTLTDNTAGVSLIDDGTATLKLDNTIVSGNANNKDLVLYEDNVGTAQTNPADPTDNGGILSVVSQGSDIPDYSIVGSDFYNGSTAGTDVGFDASTDLGPLKYNGGDTQTHALLNTDTNPAFQTGNPDYAGTSVDPNVLNNDLNKDQRGEIRLTPPCIGAYDGTEKVALNIKIFLQGPLQANGLMTNYIQTADGSCAFWTGPKLPVENPYGVKDRNGAIVSCPDILDTGKVGAIVDWIKVEVRLASNPNVVLLEEQALLLRTDGSIVDINGELPLFDVQQDPVYIMVSHRNHLSVMSDVKTSLTGNIVAHDFSTGLAEDLGFLTPMVKKYGLWCLWAGDLNGDGAIENEDYSAMLPSYQAVDEDDYLKADLNMDGMVENEDWSLFIDNYSKGLYSPIIFF